MTDNEKLEQARMSQERCSSKLQKCAEALRYHLEHVEKKGSIRHRTYTLLLRMIDACCEWEESAADLAVETATTRHDAWYAAQKKYGDVPMHHGDSHSDHAGHLGIPDYHQNIYLPKDMELPRTPLDDYRP